MLRVFQAAVVLMGGLLLMITGMVGVAREKIDVPLRWMVICCQSDRHSNDALYLLEPISGKTKRLTQYADNLQFLLIRDGWLYYFATDADGETNIYRTQVGDTPQTIFESEREANPLILSNDGQWLVYKESYDDGDHWFSRSIYQDNEHELTAEFASDSIESYVLSGFIIPIFSKDGESVYLQAIHRQRRTYEVYRARLDGTALESLTATLEPDALLVGTLPDGLVVRLSLPEPPYQQYAYLNFETDDWQRLDALLLENPNDMPIGLISPVVRLIGSDRVAIGTANLIQRGGFIPTPNGRQFLQINRLSGGALIWQATDVYNWWASPNGTWLVIMNNLGQWRAVRSNGTNEQALPFAPQVGFGSDLYWVNDTTVYVVSQLTRTRDSEPLLAQIWRLDVPEGRLTLLYESAGIIYDTWRVPEDGRLVIYEQSRRGTGLFWMSPGSGEFVQIVDDTRYREHRFDGWGPTIDRPLNGNALAGIGVLLCSIGAGMIYARFRKV